MKMNKTGKVMHEQIAQNVSLLHQQNLKKYGHEQNLKKSWTWNKSQNVMNINKFQKVKWTSTNLKSHENEIKTGKISKSHENEQNLKRSWTSTKSQKPWTSTNLKKSWTSTKSQKVMKRTKSQKSWKWQQSQKAMTINKISKSHENE